MNKKMKLFFAAFTILLLSFAFTVQADAASYQKVTSSKTKVGNYYVWIDSSSKLRFSTSSGSGGRVINSCSSAITNGGYVFYSKPSGDGMHVYRYKLKVKANSRYCYIKHGESVVGLYGGNLYITRHNAGGKYGHDYTLINTYAYNFSSKKISSVLFNIDADGYGKYLYGRPNTGAVMDLPLKIYDCNTKKTKTIESKAFFFKRIGSYIYYAKVVGQAGATFPVKIYRYHMGNKIARAVSSKTFNCSYIVDISSKAIKYADKNNRIVTAGF